jgi:hypothetical protein
MDMEKIWPFNSPKRTSALLGIGLSKTYELMRAGKLVAKRLDSGTKIPGESIEAYMAALPDADMQRGPRHQPQAAAAEISHAICQPPERPQRPKLLRRQPDARESCLPALPRPGAGGK